MEKYNRYWKEFKEFAVKGNVVDLAVAVIIGGAFGKIVSSLVADVVMPVVGVIIGGFNFAGLKIVLKKAILGADGVTVAQAVTINIGNFIQNIFDFLIIALAIFFMIKLMSKIKSRLIREEEEAKKEEEPKALSKDQELLIEIRDLLKK